MDVLVAVKMVVQNRAGTILNQAHLFYL